MADEMSIVSQSQSTEEEKHSLAFKQKQYAEKCLVLSTETNKKEGTVYLIKIENGANRVTLKYKKWEDACNLVQTFEGRDFKPFYVV